MATLKEQLNIRVSDIGYNTGVVWNENMINMKEWAWKAKMALEIGGTIVAIVLLFVAIVMMIRLTTKLNEKLVFGIRSQKLCGQNYMEYESARNKLYNEYNSSNTTKKIKNIKILLSVSLIIIVSVLVISIGLMWIGNKDIKWEKSEIGYYIYFIGAGVSLAGLLITFFILNHKAVLENTYGDSKTEKKLIPILLLLLLSIVLICIINIVFIHPRLNDKTSTLRVLMLAAIFTISFMLVINLRTKKINDNFISKYTVYSNEINDQICNLGKNKDIISEGMDRDTSVKDWTLQLLSRNYKRIHRDEADGDLALHFGDKMECSKVKSKMLYAYLEHNHGKELDELPNRSKARNSRNIIRQNMWNMRNENNTMMKPVKQFIRQMRIFLLMVLFVLLFMVYHVAYINYPGYTKLTLVAIILILTLVIMYSVIIGR